MGGIVYFDIINSSPRFVLKMKRVYNYVPMLLLLHLQHDY